MVKDPHNQFLLYLCETLHTDPSDPKIADMPAWQRLWWYYSWVNKLDRESELKRGIAILTGSFFNPEGAQKMMKKMNPDVELSEEEAERQAQDLHEHIVREEQSKEQTQGRIGRRKKRRRMLTDG